MYQIFFSASIPSADTFIGFVPLGTKRKFKGFINKVAIYNHFIRARKKLNYIKNFITALSPTEKPVRGFELV